MVSLFFFPKMVLSNEPGVVVYTCNPSIQEAETGLLVVLSQPVLQVTFRSTKSHSGRPCLGEKIKQGTTKFFFVTNLFPMK